MITDINSEDRLFQKTFAKHLHDSLGWDSVYAYNDETFGPWHVGAPLVSVKWCWFGAFGLPAIKCSNLAKRP